MWMGWVLFFSCGFYSIWLRTNRYRQDVQMDTRISPLSMALQELIGVAGGIYLSLIMMISFLKITLPEKVVVFMIGVDPLAFSSLCLVIFQPILLNLLKKVK